MDDINKQKMKVINARETRLGENSIPEGWIDLVVELDQKLSKIDPNYRVTQYKVKFGGLRYYIQPSENLSKEKIDEMYKLEYKYEAESYKICEKCSTKVDKSTTPYKTLCKKCQKQNEQNI